ncbi:MAG: hypothetical protein PV344_07325, partial [Anaplasma sp.]|nr:hypothetical protein [Anaplasma sp.]
MKLFASNNFREANVASVVLTYCPDFSRDLFFANRLRKLGPRENLVVYSIYETAKIGSKALPGVTQVAVYDISY